MPSWIQDHDLKLLRIFHAIAKSGGFTQAQVELNLSQSSISTYMSQLETRVGIRLCQRGHTGFALTDEGQAVLKQAEELFGALKHFAVQVSETKANLMGDLDLGVIESSVTHPNTMIVKAIANFRKRALGVHINIYAGGALELEERMLDGRLHLAIGLFPHKLDGLEYSPLFEENHLLYCGQDHPLFARAHEKLSLKQMSDADFVSRDYVDLVSGLEPPATFKDVASAPHMEGLVYLILSGQYVAYLPDHIAEYWVERDEMRVLNVPDSTRSAWFQLVLRKGGKYPRVLNEFLEVLPLPEK